MTIVDAASSAARTFTATFLLSESCSASYTAAMPPRPISRTTRYFPTRICPTGIFDSLAAISRLAAEIVRPLYAKRKGFRATLAHVGSREDLREKTERLAAIGEIAAEVAHELRNALQIIS